MASHKCAKNSYLAPSLTAQLPVDLPSTSYLFHSTVLVPPQQTSCCFYSYKVTVRHTGQNLLWRCCTTRKKFLLTGPPRHHSKFFRFPIPHEDRGRSLDDVQNFSRDYDHITVSTELFSSKYTIPLTCDTSNKNNCESTKKQCSPTALHLEHLNHVSGSHTRPFYYLEFLFRTF